MQDTTKNEKEIEKRVNPFFEPYNTPHNTAPFHRIQLGDYEEAFMEGIRRDDEATDKIVNDPAEPATTDSYAAVPSSTRKARRNCASSPRMQACSPFSSHRTC